MDARDDLCATGCGGAAIWGSRWTKGQRICRDCFDGWYECGITDPRALKLRSSMYRAGATAAAVEAALTETFGEHHALAFAAVDR